MESLKFNLSFKQSEILLYKFVVEQRAPAAFIKDAISFYIEHLKKESEQEKEMENLAPIDAETLDLLSF